MRNQPQEVLYKTLQAAAAATGNGTPIVVGNPATGAFVLLGLQITGTFVGTVTFEGTINGTDWFTVEAIAMANSVSGQVTTATAPGGWRVNISGLHSFRARISAYTSGNITVVARAIS